MTPIDPTMLNKKHPFLLLVYNNIARGRITLWYMQLISRNWKTYLTNQIWTHIATVRLHYKMNEYVADKMTTSLVKSNQINHLFYAVENDRLGINHMHLLLNGMATVTTGSIAKGLGKYSKAVSYLKEVHDQEAVSWYCSKQLSNDIPHDIKFKHQYI